MNTSLILHTVLGLLLLLIPAGLLYLLERPMLKSFGIAVGRAIMQLLVLCLVVWALIRFNSPWLLLAWLVVIAAYSGWLVLKRCKQEVRRLWLPVSAGLLIGVSLVGFWLLGLVFPVRVFDARWFVPVMALLMGHATAMMIRGLNTYLSALKEDEQQYEFLRGNGLAHWKSLQPFLRRSLLAVISPTVANLSVLGLPSMPLLLVGILLGGLSPVNAFILMLGMIAGCVSASVLSLALTILLMDRSLFDKLGKLIWIMALVLALGACKDGKSGDKPVQTTFLNTQKAKVVTMYEQPAPLKDRPEQILHKRGFTISYNRETKNPNWVAWHLTSSHTNGSFQRKQEMFQEDVEVKAPRATDNDYYNSRFDRGHMCPAGDNKWDREAMRESFLFTNICPQNHGLNKYEWNDLEIQCREWAKEYGAVDIVCGPIYQKGREQRTIGRNKVWVPDAFFKVILCRKGTPKAIGFIYRNEGKKQTQQEALHSVDEIEALTGIDFFPALDDKTEQKIEAEASLSAW